MQILSPRYWITSSIFIITTYFLGLMFLSPSAYYDCQVYKNHNGAYTMGVKIGKVNYNEGSIVIKIPDNYVKTDKEWRFEQTEMWTGSNNPKSNWTINPENPHEIKVDFMERRALLWANFTCRNCKTDFQEKIDTFKQECKVSSEDFKLANADPKTIAFMNAFMFVFYIFV